MRHKARLDFAFRHYHPQVVFHAAAYKHVPLMEENPCEAVLVNVYGSRNVADKCIEYDVEKMVMISTDKAVNPTNVMGCSKRLAEIYVQTLGLAVAQGKHEGKTKFVTTRFGKLGKDVLKAEIDILKEIGVEICTGVEVGKDIEIAYTGLRPGEKLYEEVLSNKENTLPTSHERIRIAKVREYEYNEVAAIVDELEDLSRKVEIPDMVKLMKRTVPEFISKNSRFEIYDKH